MQESKGESRFPSLRWDRVQAYSARAGSLLTNDANLAPPTRLYDYSTRCLQLQLALDPFPIQVTLDHSSQSIEDVREIAQLVSSRRPLLFPLLPCRG